MEKKTKKGMKKLLLSVCAMVIALIGTVTSTYAWFTMTASPQVGDFQVKVTTVSGLEIALDDREFVPVYDASGYQNPENILYYTADTSTKYTDLDYKSYITGTEIEEYLTSIIRSSSANGLTANTNSTELLLAPSMTTTGKAFTDIDGKVVNSSRLNGADKGRFFLASDDKNEVGFLEFTLYFRISEADLGADNNSVVLDMFNYSGTADDHKDGGADVRTFVTHDTNGNAASIYTLPTRWTGVGANTDVVALANDGSVYTGATGQTLEYYVIPNFVVINPDYSIAAININKYLNSGVSGDGTYVVPSNGAAVNVSWAGNVPTVGGPGVAGSFTDSDYVKATATGVEILGYGANALKMSFAQVDKTDEATFDEKTAEGAAIMWDPRANLGIFDDDTATGGTSANFALHMLWASGKEYTMPANYTNDVVKGRTEGTIGDKAISTLTKTDDTANTTFYGATTIRLWIDGWDAECFDGIMARIATIGFQFKLAQI